MRRILVGLTAFSVVTGTMLVLPVYAAPGPEPEPVTTSTEEIPMGSVDAPAPAADVQEGTTEPAAGVPDSAPTLTVTRTDVDEFSLVGVTWAFDTAVTDTLVKVRVQDSAGSWGEWTEVLAETADQGAGTTGTGVQLRGGTSPLWTGPSAGVEAELVTRSGAQPTDVQLDLVDPGESAADSALTSPDITDTAHAATTMPPVHSRAQWGADEGIRTWAPQNAATIKAATLHHTADSNGYNADQVPAIMRSIYTYHTQRLGWGDIGYNVIIDKFGRLWEGRYGGLASTVIGAHAGGFNTGTFGVSMLGNYDVVPVPQATVDSVAAIIAWKFSLYGVNPRGTTTLTSGGGGTARYAAGTPVTLPTIFGHRDVGSTACPGQYGYARLGEIRDRVTALMGESDGPPNPAIEARYAGDAGLRGLLGAKVGGTRSAGDVVWQVYANGRLYYSPGSGVRLVKGALLERYLAAGGPASLGAPINDESATPDGRGRYNHLTSGGSLYWTAATGAHVVTSTIRVRWEALGWEQGPLGYPTTDTACGLTGGGCRQEFERGMVVWSPATGAHMVGGAIGNRWRDLGQQTGTLGYPVGAESCGLVGGGCVQHFQGGSLYWSPATGAQFLRGSIRDLWASMGRESSWLGYPTTGEICGLRGGGCVNYFQNGSIFWSPATGARAVNTVLMGTWQALGWEAGPVGYPLTQVACGLTANGCYAHFQGGSLYWSPASGTHFVRGPIRELWASMGWEGSWLGYPTTDQICGLRGDGCVTYFQNGSIFWSPATGARAVNTVLMGTWQALGWEAGVVGYPVTHVACGLTANGCYAHFQGGSLYWSPATGTHFVRGTIRELWASMGWEGSWLRYPTGDEQCGLRGGGCFTHFQDGSIYWAPGTGAHAVPAAIRAAWAATGWEAGGWGYPTGDLTAVTGGATQRFQGGTATWNTTTGTVTFR